MSATGDRAARPPADVPADPRRAETYRRIREDLLARRRGTGPVEPVQPVRRIDRI
jgi:hypothetical protein